MRNVAPNTEFDAVAGTVALGPSDRLVQWRDIIASLMARGRYLIVVVARAEETERPSIVAGIGVGVDDGEREKPGYCSCGCALRVLRSAARPPSRERSPPALIMADAIYRPSAFDFSNHVRYEK